MHTYVLETCIHERIRDLASKGGSEIEREHGNIKHPVLGIGGFKKSMQDKKSGTSANRSLSYPIDRSKEVISNNILWTRPLM